MDSKKDAWRSWKGQVKKRKSLEYDAAKCAKLTNIFSRQTSTRELATQGNLTVTSNMYSYAFGKRFYPRWLTLNLILFIQFSYFFYRLSVSIKCKWHCNYIDMDIKNNSAKKYMSYAKFTLHDFSRIFQNRQVLINRRQTPNIGCKSVLVHNRAETIVQCELSKTRSEVIADASRHLHNIWHAKYLELLAIHNPAVWMSSDWKS